MDCKECGASLQTGDRECQQCGTPVEGDQEYRETEKKSGSSEFQWNIYDFPKPRKTEEIDFDWGDTSDVSIEKNGEKPQVDLLKEIESMPPSQEEADPAIDKFFTFNKKNEDFQKLLDREYEKMQGQEMEPLPLFDIDEPLPEELPEEEAFVIIEDDPEQAEEPIFVLPIEPIMPPEEKMPEPASELVPDPVPSSEPPSEPPSDPPLWFEQEEDVPEEEEPRKKSGCVSRVILILIILFLIAEAAALGIKYFSPESAASAKVTEIQIAVSRTLDQWKDRAVAFFSGSDEEAETPPEGDAESETEPPEDTEEPEEPETPDPNPAADKNEIIASLSSINENIGIVRANPDLAYEEGRNYGIRDVNASEPLTDNIWITDDDPDVRYYDREIIATLMAFDSRWNDYVNGGEDSVLKLTKEGSQAYNNVANFSKVGNVTQEFLLLEIGEIRRGSGGFYVWTYEEIKEIDRSSSVYKKYPWIYRLEPVDGEMKVTDYYRYKRR